MRPPETQAPTISRRGVSLLGILLLVAALLALGYLKRDELYIAFKYPRPQRSLAWIEEYGYKPDQVYNFEFGSKGVGVPVVTAKVQGREVKLVLDTGTADYASLFEKTIYALQLPITGWTNWRDSSGRVVTKIPIAKVETLEFGPLRLKDIEVAATGPESIVGTPRGYGGTLGWKSLLNYRITLDYSNQKLALTRSALPPPIQNCGTRHVTHFRSPSDLDGLILVEGNLAGKDVYVEVDTGKSSTELDPKASSLHEFRKGYWGYVVEDVTVGPFEVKSRFGRMWGGFGGFGQGLDRPAYVGVGSDFLTRFLVTIDYPNRLLVLEERPCQQ